MSSVDLAFIAALGERNEGERARRSRSAGHHHVRRRGNVAQRLRGYRGICARVALVG